MIIKIPLKEKAQNKIKKKKYVVSFKSLLNCICYRTNFCL